MNFLIEQEIALHQYEVRQNKADIIRLLHPEFREVGESGTSYDFQSINAMMEEEQASNGYIHSQDFECINLEASVQMLLYKSASVNELGIKSHFAKRVSIWVLDGEQWQLKYHQGTPCDSF
ncbi:Putative uncharacterized protein [Moritella viscosa]|uniref:nuclear transport factor 2 family protein n=1 Tax=Moritella viscosa TaxID=80854 RepID=UPI00050917F9|nr:DUF4440 domain-containing protein [Moritella viscosa]CED61193.1 putative uncharacterized protein [Moritella viscosa]SGY91065.1 Putative uncharacterized protein [Moritella viscosa]SGY91118.1 Putative uncharacterized protein [Moritella viscosa]SHO04252.1 Putative uncharacterized protein [Moritella viscosa]SHO21126.1 Putative uncharacterized protein [Moritella viscosa]